jgi:hypothetical protein
MDTNLFASRELHISGGAAHGFLHLSFLLSTPYVVVIKVHRVRSSCREQVVAWALLRKEQAILCSWEALIVIMMHDVVRFICLVLGARCSPVAWLAADGALPGCCLLCLFMRDFSRGRNERL